MEKEVYKTQKRAVEKGKCFDCGKEVKVNKKEIEGGALLVYEDNQEEVFVLKCNDCLKANKELTDYKKCEVYSRIVGYLRPVNQWNAGKRQEYSERKTYKVSQS